MHRIYASTKGFEDKVVDLYFIMISELPEENKLGRFDRMEKRLYRIYVKRLLDILCSIGALIVLSPLMVVVSVLIHHKLGRPVLFIQERIGKDERPFRMYKFRSMSCEKNECGELLPDIQRTGKFGAFLRSSSIDELPALVNVLKGDMSVIGPRPLPTLYKPYFHESERKRHSIRGGLSGLAQVSGRNALSWEQKFAYDNQYVDTVSFWLDVKIVIVTIKKVFQRSDIGLRGVTGPEDFNTYRMHQMEISK